MTHHDTVSDFVSMASAYVLPADTANIHTILKLLDMHGIAYTKIRAGSTLTLRKYEGLVTVNTSAESVTIGEAKEVLFEDGAYVVTLDTSDSYLITYLFEPDSFPYTSAAENMHSFVNMGYLTDDDSLYRSEISDMTTIVVGLSEVAGDVDCDGDVDISDVLTALKALVNEDNSTVFDMNGDGVFTLVDILRILKLAVR